MEQKTQIGRQIVEGTENIRIYNSRVLLSDKKLPIITRDKVEVANWIYLTEQKRLHDEIRDLHGGSGKISVFEKTEGEAGSMHPLMQAVLEIPGVAYAIPASYQLVVIKAALFTWEEIEKHILLLMSSFSLDDLESISEAEGVNYQAEKNACSATDEKTSGTV